MKEDRRGSLLNSDIFCSGWSSLVFVFIHFPSTFCYSAAYAYPSNCNTGQKGYNFPFIKNEVDLKREHNHHKLNIALHTHTGVFKSPWQIRPVLGWKAYVWRLWCELSECTDKNKKGINYDSSAVSQLQSVHASTVKKNTHAHVGGLWLYKGIKVSLCSI